jgi:hypothetical protein
MVREVVKESDGSLSRDNTILLQFVDIGVS